MSGSHLSYIIKTISAQEYAISAQKYAISAQEFSISAQEIIVSAQKYTTSAQDIQASALHSSIINNVLTILGGIGLTFIA